MGRVRLNLGGSGPCPLKSVGPGATPASVQPLYDINLTHPRDAHIVVPEGLYLCSRVSPVSFLLRTMASPFVIPHSFPRRRLRHPYTGMDVKKLKDLKKIIEICKKTGVIELKFEGIELKLAHSAVLEPSKYKQQKNQESSDEPQVETYSETDTLFWSSNGLTDQLSEAQ